MKPKLISITSHNGILIGLDQDGNLWQLLNVAVSGVEIELRKIPY